MRISFAIKNPIAPKYNSNAEIIHCKPWQHGTCTPIVKVWFKMSHVQTSLKVGLQKAGFAQRMVKVSRLCLHLDRADKFVSIWEGLGDQTQQPTVAWRIHMKNEHRISYLEVSCRPHPYLLLLLGRLSTPSTTWTRRCQPGPLLDATCVGTGLASWKHPAVELDLTEPSKGDLDWGVVGLTGHLKALW